jgi:hypothetical protein
MKRVLNRAKITLWIKIHMLFFLTENIMRQSLIIADVLQAVISAIFHLSSEVLLADVPSKQRVGRNWKNAHAINRRFLYNPHPSLSRYLTNNNNGH